MVQEIKIYFTLLFGSGLIFAFGRQSGELGDFSPEVFILVESFGLSVVIICVVAVWVFVVTYFC